MINCIVVLIRLLLVLTTGSVVSGWSFPSATSFLKRRLVKQKKQQPPRHVQSLMDHLTSSENKKSSGFSSKSKLNKRLSVVSLTKNECGVKFQTSSSSSLSKEDRIEEEVEEEEIAWINRKEFITPECGKQTTIGKALTEYLRKNEDVQKEYNDILPSVYVAIFLCLNHVSGTNDKQTMNDAAFRETAQKFTEYMDTLPSTEELQHLPVYWNLENLEELQGSPLYHGIKERRSDWFDEYNLVLNATKTFAIEEKRSLLQFDFDTWCWSRSIITSRGFTDRCSSSATTTKTAGSSSSLCLVPFADMMNHCNSESFDSDEILRCSWEIRNDGFHLNMPTTSPGSSKRDDDENANQKSKEVEISYGTNSNSALLLNYGFALLDDSHAQTCLESAVVPMKLLQPTTTELSSSYSTTKDIEMIADMWERDGLGSPYDISRNITLSISNPGAAETLLSMCRVACCQDCHELRQMQQEFVKRGETATQQTTAFDGLVPQMAATLCRLPFSIDNEIRAMKRFLQLILDQLSGYKTSIVEDDALLVDTKVARTNSLRLRNAIIVRRSEKRVLAHFCALAQLSLTYLYNEYYKNKDTQDDDSNINEEQSDKTSGVDFDMYKGLLDATLANQVPLI